MSEGLWVTEANKSISKTIKIYSDNAAINSLITEFNKEYPNVTVEVSQSSSALTYGDINFTDSFTLLKNYEANKVLDLTSLINASKTAGAYNTVTSLSVVTEGASFCFLAIIPVVK